MTEEIKTIMGTPFQSHSRLAWTGNPIAGDLYDWLETHPEIKVSVKVTLENDQVVFLDSTVESLMSVLMRLDYDQVLSVGFVENNPHLFIL